MPIPNSTLGRWGHHYSGTAPKQAHMSIRNALANYAGWGKETKFKMLLQGSYKNSTNLRRDSDVDVVLQLMTRIRPRVAELSGVQLEQDEGHKFAYDSWRSFHKQVLKALRANYGTDVVASGRKSLKISKGKIPASADVVVTLKYKTGLAFYLPDEHRWTVSYPQQHHTKGLKKEKATGAKYKQTIRIFKSARNHLVKNKAMRKDTASSYFIECLLYNVPNDRFNSNFSQCYHDVIEYLSSANLQQFKCQNGVQKLFGPSKDLWNVDKAQTFIQALIWLWNEWPQ